MEKTVDNRMNGSKRIGKLSPRVTLSEAKDPRAKRLVHERVLRFAERGFAGGFFPTVRMTG